MEHLLHLSIEQLERKTEWDKAWGGIKDLAPDPLYEIPGYGQGTITQYAMYANLRQWEVSNDQALALANSIGRTSDLLRAMGRVLKQISGGNASEYSPADVGDFIGVHSPVSPTIMEFLVDECGLKESDVLGMFGSENSRDELLEKIQQRIRLQMNENDNRQADLVVALGRADSYFGAASNLIKQIGKSQQTSTMGLKR